MEKAIEIVDLSKSFLLRHNRVDSLKSRFVGLFHKRYREERETFCALRDISLDVYFGETFGFIGRNGSGKSTLLKLVAGILAPTSGSVRLHPGFKIGTMIELGVGFNAELTGRENVYLNASIHGLNRREIDFIFHDVVQFSELGHFIDVPIKNYSSGMQMRLAFAIAAQLDPDILLLDEILAVGDESFQKKCMRKIEEFQKRGKTILFVSHSFDAVEALCARVCLLEHGRALFVGKPLKAISHYHHLIAGQPLLIEPEHTGGSSEAQETLAQRDSPEPIGGRWGSGEVVVSDVVFLNAAGERTKIFPAGSRFTARVSYKAFRRVDHPVLGLAIRKEDGTLLVGPNTKLWNYPIDCLEGEGSIDYTVNALPLLPGRYLFTAALFDYMCTSAFDFRDQQFAFEVVESELIPDRCGLFHIPAHWHWLPQPKKGSAPEVEACA